MTDRRRAIRFLQRRLSRYLGLLVVLLGLASCGIPRDLGSAWEDAQSMGLKVGVASNPPFTDSGDEQFAGKEVAMIRRFARQNGLDIDFVGGSESALVRQLEDEKLHVVVGGIEKQTIWESKAGLSRPYDGEHVFLIPKGQNRLLYELEHFMIAEGSGL